MSTSPELGKQIRQRSTLLNGLLLLDAFVLGGLVAMWLVYQELVSTMHRLIKIEAQQEILNALDHLLPYWVYYIGIALVMALLTLGIVLWPRTRSRGI